MSFIDSFVQFIFFFFFFFFNDTATTEIYTLSLHDALPILAIPKRIGMRQITAAQTHAAASMRPRFVGDRKSTRLNSSHQIISYAVFCLKKKKKKKKKYKQKLYNNNDLHKKTNK